MRNSTRSTRVHVCHTNSLPLSSRRLSNLRLSHQGTTSNQSPPFQMNPYSQNMSNLSMLPPQPALTFTLSTFLPLRPSWKSPTEGHSPLHRPIRTVPAALSQNAQPFSRRSFNALLTAFATAALAPYPATALAPDVASKQTEESEIYGYSFEVPAKGWTRSTASISSFRTVVVFLSDDDSDSNINMVSTPVPGDFQKLTSFGLLENVLVSISMTT